jgi:exodeoxyribonuclease VII large subunit
MELADSMKELLVGAKEKLHIYYEQIVKIEPHRLLGKKRDDLSSLQNRVGTAIQDIFDKRRIQLTAQANRLAALNPKSVLQRGYSITTNKKTGRVVARLGDIEIGDTVATELADRNLFESRVTKK